MSWCDDEAIAGRLPSHVSYLNTFSLSGLAIPLVNGYSNLLAMRQYVLHMFFLHSGSHNRKSSINLFTYCKLFDFTVVLIALIGNFFWVLRTWVNKLAKHGNFQHLQSPPLPIYSLS